MRVGKYFITFTKRDLDCICAQDLLSRNYTWRLFSLSLSPQKKACLNFYPWVKILGKIADILILGSFDLNLLFLNKMAARFFWNNSWGQINCLILWKCILHFQLHRYISYHFNMPYIISDLSSGHDHLKKLIYNQKNHWKIR